MAEPRKPNVIVFFTDQQRWDTTGVHGNPLDLTPNFDRMARTRNGRPLFVHLPAGLRPGALVPADRPYATNTGVFRNGDRARPAMRDAGQMLSRAAATPPATSASGTWRLAGPGAGRAARRLRLLAGLQPAGVHLGRLRHGHVRQRGQAGQIARLPRRRPDRCRHPLCRQPPGGSLLPLCLLPRAASPEPSGRLSAAGRLPRAIHRSLDAARPGGLGGSSPQHLGGYYGMVKRLDEALGRLLDALRSLDMLDNTVVLFTSDHGYHFKTRNAEYKRSCHEASIRVPTAFSGPGFDGGGQLDGTGQPGRSAAHAARRCRPADSRRDGGTLDPAAGAPPGHGVAGGGLRPDQRVAGWHAPSAPTAGSIVSTRRMASAGAMPVRTATWSSRSTICTPIPTS